MKPVDHQREAHGDYRLAAVGCEPIGHDTPLGWEVRCDVDDHVRQTAVLRPRENAVEQAGDWQQAFKAKGGRYEAVRCTRALDSGACRCGRLRAPPTATDARQSGRQHRLEVVYETAGATVEGPSC